MLSIEDVQTACVLLELEPKKPHSPDEGFSRGLWHSEVSSTWHFREFFVFPYGIAVSSSRPEKARRQAILIPPQETNSQSAHWQSARHETRHVRHHPLLRVPLREGARRAWCRQGARRGRRAPRRAPRLRGPRRGQEEGYVAPIFLPSSIRLDRAREAALAAFARSRTGPSPRRDRSARVPPQAASARARRRPGPASGRFHRVVLFADGITFSNHAQVPSP